MNKRKLATLVAASFAGLMLSSPSFATDANKAQTTSGSSTSAQTTASASGAPESRSAARADKRAAGSDASGNTGTNSSEKAEADAKAEYKAAIEKCDAQPTGQRSACVQDAEEAQTLALQQSRDGTSSSGAPEARSSERADDKADKSDASSSTAMKNQTDSNTPRKTGAPESRVPGKQSAK